MSNRDNVLEASLVAGRVKELQENPVHGNYDAAHLRETHRYLFQDLPRARLWNYDIAPGEYRKETISWSKERRLESMNGENGRPPDVSFTSYSRMDKKSIEKLNSVLEEAKPGNFKGLDKKSFVEKMSVLYSDLDYLHPFREGNSRTLRTFTEQLARESGYKLNWKKFEGLENRDVLYIARDRGLVERALRDEGHHPPSLAKALYDMHRHKYFPGLTQLLDKTVEKVQTQERYAPRHDMNKNQPQMHVAVTERINENIEALKKNPVFAGRTPEALEKLAYYRGILQENLKGQPPSAQENALAKFDKMAEDPSVLEKLEQSGRQEAEETKVEPRRTQEREDYGLER
jgi:fido (protein-threonine AMPylation protein)